MTQTVQTLEEKQQQFLLDLVAEQKRKRSGPSMVGHRKGGVGPGRYPVKASRAVIKLIQVLWTMQDTNTKISMLKKWRLLILRHIVDKLEEVGFLEQEVEQHHLIIIKSTWKYSLRTLTL